MQRFLWLLATLPNYDALPSNIAYFDRLVGVTDSTELSVFDALRRSIHAWPIREPFEYGAFDASIFGTWTSTVSLMPRDGPF